MRLLALLAALCSTACTHLVWYGKSPDRRHVAAVIEQAGSQWVRHDLRDGPDFKGIGVDQLRLDEGHCAYPALVEGGGWVVVVDGKPGERFDAIGQLTLSGSHVLYAGERGGQWFVVHDRELHGPFDDVLSGSLRISGSTWAVATRRGGQTFVIAGGTELGPFEGAGQFTFSGGDLLFAARAAEGAYVYAGAKQRFGPWDEVADLTAGERVVFSVRSGDRWQLNEGGPLFDRVSGLTLDGAELVYAGRRDSGDWVVHGERERGPFKALKKRLGVGHAGAFFAGHRDDAWWVMCGDEALGPWDEVTSLTTANRHDAFIGWREGHAVVVVDGEQRSSWDEAASLVLSPDGARLMFVARKGADAFLVVDGVATRYDLILADTLKFSHDGRHLGVVVGEASTRRLYIDVDRSRRVPVDVEELTAAVSRLPLGAVYSPDAAVLSRWVEAELALRFDENVNGHD